ncbi:unnamed protein product [Calicophoron daubneyi]|uniref:Ig-like domain-containing protein n=1 Tax=Calicophoron daubneyi TaxID=300641 RepID=A0AAV2TFD5_CALDB
MNSATNSILWSVFFLSLYDYRNSANATCDTMPRFTDKDMYVGYETTPNVFYVRRRGRHMSYVILRVSDVKKSEMYCDATTNEEDRQMAKCNWNKPNENDPKRCPEYKYRLRYHTGKVSDPFIIYRMSNAKMFILTYTTFCKNYEHGIFHLETGSRRRVLWYGGSNTCENFCPEISRNFDFEGGKLRRFKVDEKHDLFASELNEAVTHIDEGEDAKIKLFAHMCDQTQIAMVVYYEVDKKLLGKIINPQLLRREFPTGKKTYEEFTERITMAKNSGRDNIRTVHFQTGIIGPRDKYLIILTTHGSIQKLSAKLTEMINMWYKNEALNISFTQFVRPERSTSIRAIKLKVYPVNIYWVGQTKTFYSKFTSLKCTRYCENNWPPNETVEDIKITDGTATLVLKDKTYSGFYTCKEGESVVFSDTYIVVLPIAEDIKVFVRKDAASPKDDFHHKDGRGGYYVQKPLVIICQLTFSNCLHNPDSISLQYEGIADEIKCTYDKDLRTNKTNTQGRCYQVKRIVEGKASCRYLYRKTVKIQQLKPVEYQVEKSVQLYPYTAVQPKIMSESVETNSWNLTNTLQNMESDSAWLEKNVTVNEGWTTGEFKAQLSEKYSWGSVWLVVEDENGARSRVDCQLRHESIDNKGEEQIVKRFKFGCPLTISAIRMVFSLYDMGIGDHKESKVEDEYTKFIISKEKERPEFMPPVLSFLRIINLDVRWRATISEGERMLILCHKDSDVVQEYSVTYHKPFTEEYRRYSAKEIPNQLLFSLEREEVVSDWTGFLKCLFKSKKSSEWWKGRRRIVVILPNMHDVIIHFRTRMGKKKIIETSHNSPSKALSIDETKELEVWCEYWLNYDLIADKSMTVKHESYDKGGQYINLPTELREKEREISTEWWKSWRMVQYRLRIPLRYDYRDHARIICQFNISNLTRDPADVLSYFGSHTASSVRYVRYPVKPIEGNISDITFRPQLPLLPYDKEIEKQLKVGEQQKAPFTIREGLYELNYTVFLGHPRGVVKVWVIYKSVAQEVHIDSLKLGKPTNITGCGGHSKGLCQKYQVKFALQINDLALFIVLIRPEIKDNGDIDLRTNEKEFYSTVKTLFKSALPDKIVRYPHQNFAHFRVAQIKPCWISIVDTGNRFVMYGRGDGAFCEYGVKESDWRHRVNTTKLVDSAAFRIEKDEADIEDSGFYRCSDYPAHELVVLPDESMFEIRIDNERQSDNGNFIMYSSETTDVHCVHTSTEYEGLKPTVSLLCKKGVVQIQPQQPQKKEKKKYTVWTNYVYTAPNVYDFGGGELNLTCRFEYRITTTVHCGDQKREFYVYKTKRLTIKGFQSPAFFFETLESNAGAVFERITTGAKNEMSAVDFQSTASKSRINETPLNGSLVVNLGEPRGIITIYLPRTNKTPEFSCTLTTKNLSESESKTKYPSAHGKNLVEASFKCVVQAEHEAMAFLVYTNNECGMKNEAIEDAIKKSIEENVKYWLENPTEQTRRRYEPPKGVLATVAVIKLKIGFCASVHVNTTWSMLGVANSASVTCYRKTNIEDDYKKSEAIKEICDSNYFKLTNKYASYSDSGYYKCNDSLESGFPDRKLIVLPTESMMHIHFKKNMNFTEAFSQGEGERELSVYANQSFGVRCEFPPSQMADLRPRVDLIYNRRGQKGQDPVKLAAQNDHVDHWITAPMASYPAKKLSFTCVVKYLKLKSNEIDTCANLVRKVFKLSRDIILKPRNYPTLYKTHIASNQMKIFHYIDRGMKDKMTTEDFENTSSPEALAEGIVNVSMFQDLGQPYGTPTLYVFRKDGANLTERKCIGGVKYNISSGQIIVSSLRKEFNKNRFGNFVKAFFTCAVRVFDEVMAFVTYNKITSENDDKIESELVGGIKENWKNWKERSVAPQGVKLPDGVLAKFAIIKLNIGYRATVRISEPWHFIGILPRNSSTLQCFYSPDRKKFRLVNGGLINKLSNSYFQLGRNNAIYSDSGYYFCNSSSHNDSEAGFTERKLLVLPNNDTLSMELKIGTMSFRQIKKGRYYLYSDQNLTVECKYLKPNVSSLSQTVSFEYRVVDMKGKPVSLSYKIGRSTHIVSPPKTNGVITLACRVKWSKRETIERDLSPLEHPIILYKEQEINVIMVDQPKIFPQYITSNRPEFFNRIHPSRDGQISGRQFHLSSTENRIIEGWVSISMIQNVGLPRGRSSMYLFRGEWDYPIERKCGDANWTDLTKSKVPRELQRTESYVSTNGVSFGLANFSCVVQAENVAMLFLVFSKTETNLTDELLEKDLINGTKQLLKRLAEKPEDDEQQFISLPSGTHATFLILKLNVGFHASVHISESWSMLGVSPNIGSSLKCYQSSDGLKFRQLEETLIKDHQNGSFMFGKENAEYLDTADYMCNGSSANDSEAGFRSRRLLVLPDKSIMDIHLSLEDLQSIETSKDDLPQKDGDDSFLYSNQHVYVRILYRRPADLMPHVATILEYTYVDYQHTVKKGQTPQPGTNFSNATHEICEYNIVAPSAAESEGPLNIKFTLEYNLPLFEKVFENWKTNSRDNETAEDFSRSQPRTLFAESVVSISSIQNLGLPRGQSYAYLFHEEKNMSQQECMGITQTAIRKPQLDELQNKGGGDEKLLREVRLHTRDRSFVNASFECVIQAEHYAIAFITVNKKSPGNFTPIKLGVVENIRNALRAWRDNRTYTYTMTGDTADAFYTSVILKLNVGWQASVHLGMPWKMLVYSPYVQTEEQQPKFVSGGHANTPPSIKIASNYSIYYTKEVSEFLDSGQYSCTFTKSENIPCFTGRRLFVRPNSMILRTYICHQDCFDMKDIETACELYKLGTPVLMVTDLSKYLCFVYESPKGLISEAEEKYTYTTMDGEKIGGVKHLGKVRRDKFTTSGYSILGSASEGSDTNFTLILSYDNHNLDGKDVNRNRKIDSVSVSIIFTLKLLVPPYIYVSSLKATDVSLKRGLKESLVRTNQPLDFRKLQVVSISNENTYKITITYATGKPKGKIIMKAVYGDGKQQKENPCFLARSDAIVKPPGNIKFMKIHRNMLKNATFSCVLRQEHDVLSIAAFSAIETELDGEPEMEKENEMTGSFLTWVRDLKKDKTGPEWSGVAGTLVDMRIARMKIGWSQRVLTGSSVKMLGFLGAENTDKVNCYFNENKTKLGWKIELKKPDAFYLVKDMVDCSDSGKYRCKVDGRVGFISRFLIVTPDSSMINLHISEQWFENEEWEDSWDKVDHDGPYIYTYSDAYIGCTSKCVYDKSWKHSENLISSLGRKVDRRSLSSPTNLRYQHQILVEDVGGEILSLTCEFIYYIPQCEPISVTKTRYMHIRRIVPPKFRMNESYSDYNITEKLRTPIENGFYFVDHALSVSEGVIRINLSVQLGSPIGWTKAWTFITYNGKLVRENCMIVHRYLPSEVSAEALSTGLTNVTYECILKPETVGLVLTTANIIENGTNQSIVDETLYNSLKGGFQNLSMGRNFTKKDVKSVGGSLFDYRMMRVNVSAMGPVAINSLVGILGYSYNAHRSTVHCLYHQNIRGDKAPVDEGFQVNPRTTGLGFYLTKPSVKFQDMGWYSCNIIENQVSGSSYVGFVDRLLTVLPDSSVVKLELNHGEIKRSLEKDYRNFTQCTRNNIPFLLCKQSAFLYCSFQTPTTIRFRHKFSAYLHPAHDSLEAAHVNTLIFSDSRKIIQTEVYKITAPDVEKRRQYINATCTVNYTYGEKTVPLSVSRTIWVDRRVEPYIFLRGLNTPQRMEIAEAFRNRTKTPITTAREFHSSWSNGRVLEGLLKVNYIAGLGIPRGETEVSLFFRVKTAVKRSKCINIKITNETGENIPSLKTTGYFKKANGANIVSVTAICQLTPAISAMMITAINAFGDSTSIKVTKRKFYHRASRIFRRWFDNPNSFTVTPHMPPENSGLFQRSIRIDVGWRGSVPSGSTVSMFGRASALPICMSGATKVNGMIVRRRIFSSFELILYNVSTSATGVYRCQVENTERYKNALDHRCLVVFDKVVPLSLGFDFLSASKSNSVTDLSGQTGHMTDHFLYLGQNVLAQCKYTKNRSSFLHPTISIECEPRDIPASALVCNRIDDELDEKSTLCSSRIRIPPKLTSTSLNITCKLHYGYDNSPYDVNSLYNLSFYRSKRHFALKNRTTPLIVNESFHASLSDLGEALNKITRSETLLPYQISEGQLTLNYTVDLGDPLGWTSALLIFNHSGALVFDACLPVDSMGISFTDTLRNVSFKCLLQPQHIGIFVYAAHITSGGKEKGTMVKDIEEIIGQKFSDEFYDSKSFPFPEDCDGENLLHKLNVKWNASVEIYDSVKMIGQLGKNGSGIPICYHISGRNKQVAAKKGFNVVLKQDFFEVTKDCVVYEDSGIFKCDLVDCNGCSDHLGLAERELLVLPNDNILDLRVQEASEADDNLRGCDNPEGIIKPSQEIKVTCNYRLTQTLAKMGDGRLLYDDCSRFENDQQPTEAPNVQTIEEQDEDGVKYVELLSLITLPQQEVHRCIQCRLDFSTTKLMYDQRSEVPPIRTFKKLKRYSLVEIRPPHINKYTIRSIPVEEIGKRLQDDYLSLPSLKAIKRGLASPLIKEGLVTITLKADIGRPLGRLVTYIQMNMELTDDYCNISNPQNQIFKIHCLLLPEHTALVVAAVNEPRTKETLRDDLTNWLKHPSSETPKSECYYRDVRIISLRVGWNATLWTGETATFYGRVKNETDDVICSKQSYLDNSIENISKTQHQFSYSKIPISETLIQFVFNITNVRHPNSGIYKCEANHFTVLGRHELQVIPTSVNLTLDPTHIENNQLYLMSKETAKVYCKRDPIVGFFVNDTLLYEMHNSQTNQMEDITYSRIVPEKIESGVIGYTITAVEAKNYIGPVRISCLAILTLRNISKDISAHLGGEVLSDSVNVTILEGANGELTIRTIATDFETQPVPLGSEFTCTGGYGLPPLSYNWTCKDKNDAAIYADFPKEGLVIDGAQLIVPDDDSFRGMSYMCTCEGYNTVLKTKHAITKTVTITILLCPTDKIEMNLNIVVNPCILRKCNFFHKYRHLMQQFIIGLGYKSNSVRFGFIETNSENDGSLLPVGFNHDLTARELAEKLTHFKGVCTPTGGLEKVLKTLKNAPVPVTGRNHIVLLPVDNETMNYTLDVSTLKELNSIGVKFLASFTHKVDGKLAERSKIFIENLRPIKWPQLLPEYDYGECEESKLRIHRKDLYDALCHAGGYIEPEMLLKPVLQFIPSLEQLFPGVHMILVCAVPDWTLEHETRHVQLSLCLTNKVRVMELSKYGKTNVQRLGRACNVRLATKTVRGPMNGLAVSVKVGLPRSDSNTFAFCYQRRGTADPKVFDPTSYTEQSFEVKPLIFEKPTLSIVRLPDGEKRSARFKCRIRTNVVNMRALLIAQYPTLREMANLYVVINRAELSSSYLKFPLEADLSWEQIPENASEVTVYCVVLPAWKDDRKRQYRGSLTDDVKNLVAVSKPRSLKMLVDCPSAPEMRTKPSFREKLPALGSRLEITCEANTTSEGLPLELVYLTRKHSIILCTKETLDPIRTSTPTPVPCIYLTPSTTEDCSQLLSDGAGNVNAYYPAVCSLYFSPELKVYVRRIQFVVAQLRMVDFGARVFCKTLDPIAQSVPSDRPLYVLDTEVETIRFRINPHVADFRFDPDHEEWYCSAVGFPHSDEGLIVDVHSEPGWLKAQLSRYKSNLLQQRFHILNEYLLPSGTPQPDIRGEFDLVFRPDTGIPEGLATGLAIIQCSFSGQIVRLETRTGKKPVLEEPLVSKIGMIRSNQPIRMRCLIQFFGNTAIRQIAFHRIVQYFWMKYDMTVLTVLPKDMKTPQSQETEHHGPWTVGSLPSVKVLYYEKDRSVGIEIVNLAGTEFDSGQYYCTAYTADNFLKAHTIAVSVFGTSKNATVGCRTVNKPMLWRPVLPKLTPGDIYQTMCIIWSTNPHDRVIDGLQMEDSRRQISYNHTTKILNHPSRILLGKVQQYQLIQLEDVIGHIQCTLQHHSKLSRFVIPSTKVECTIPDLTWSPMGQLMYSSAQVITCVVRSSCVRPIIVWNWLAGPIPQLTLAADEMETQRISEKDRLYLSRLPRGGTYVFSCSATCVCADKTYSSSIEVQLFVDDSDLDSKLEAEDPDIGEIVREKDDVDKPLSDNAENLVLFEHETRGLGEIRDTETEKKEEYEGTKWTRQPSSWEQGSMEGEEEEEFRYPDELRPVRRSSQWISAPSYADDRDHLPTHLSRPMDILGEIPSSDYSTGGFANQEHTLSEYAAQSKHRQPNLSSKYGPGDPGGYDASEWVTLDEIKYLESRKLFDNEGVPVESFATDRKSDESFMQGLKTSPDPETMWDTDEHAVMRRNKKRLNTLVWEDPRKARLPLWIDSTLVGLDATGFRRSVDQTPLIPRRVKQLKDGQGRRSWHDKARFKWNTQIPDTMKDSGMSKVGTFIDERGQNSRSSQMEFRADENEYAKRNTDIFGLTKAERYLIEHGIEKEDSFSSLNVRYLSRLQESEGRVVSGLSLKTPTVADYDTVIPFIGKERFEKFRDHSGFMYADKEFTLAVQDRLKAGISDIGATSSTALRPEVLRSDKAITGIKRTLYDVQRETADHHYRGGRIDDSTIDRYFAVNRQLQHRYRQTEEKLPSATPATETGSTTDLDKPTHSGFTFIESSKVQSLPNFFYEDRSHSSLRESQVSGRLYAYGQIGGEPEEVFGGDSGVADWDSEENIPVDLATALRLHAVRKDIGPHSRIVQHRGEFDDSLEGIGYKSDRSDRDSLKRNVERRTVDSIFTAKGPLTENYIEQSIDWSQTLSPLALLRENVNSLTGRRRDLPSVSATMSKVEMKKKPAFPIDGLNNGRIHNNLLRRTDYHQSNDVFNGKKAKTLETGSTLSFIKSKNSVIRRMHQSTRVHENTPLPVSVAGSRISKIGTKSGRAENTDRIRAPITNVEHENFNSLLNGIGTVEKISDSINRIELSTEMNAQNAQQRPLSSSWAITNLAGKLWERDMNSSTSWIERLATLTNVVEGKLGLSSQKQNEKQVVLDPNLIELPGTVTARCPKVEKSIRPGYQPSYVTWLHIPESNNPNSPDKEEIVRFSLLKRNIQNLSTRNELHRRVFIFPPKKWSDQMTLDIADLVPSDCGYYACVITFTSQTDRSQAINVTRLSTTPLCILPSLKNPEINILQSDGSSRHPYLKNATENNVPCLDPNEEILIQCDSPTYQLFCDRSDYMLQGHRIIETELELAIRRLHYGRAENLLTMKTSSSIKENAILSNPSYGFRISRAWRVRIPLDYHGALLTCKMKPKLLLPPTNVPPHWNYLTENFRKYYEHTLSRRSQAHRLCVTRAEHKLQIYPIPTTERIDRAGQVVTKVLHLWPNQIITCETIRQFELPPTLRVYRIMPNQADVAKEVGLSELSSWHDTNKKPVQWINITEQKRARIVISPTEDSIGQFFVICAIGQTNMTESFILQVNRDRGIHELPLNITTAGACLLITFILVLMFVMKYRRRRFRGPRLLRRF